MENKRRPRRQQPKAQLNPMLIILAGLLLFMTICMLVKACSCTGIEAPSSTTEPTQEHEDTAPTQPHLYTTASIGVTGDVMGHGPVLKSALNGNGNYDFSYIFRHIDDYFQSYDFMIANLEVTLGGEEAGDYQGFPSFNCPDEMVTALKNAGVDLLLTANNHSYDTGHDGFIRTQQVLTQMNMPYIGTRQDETAANYTVQDINGIKIGMVSYTFETDKDSNGRKTLNEHAIDEVDTNLVNSFDYADMETFYTELDTALKSMKADGADATMVFIHWGNEYQLKPSSTQQQIAQRISDLGADVIVGGHPHVVQPMAVLTGSGGNTTYCLYSAGNCISNQRRDQITNRSEGYTEDGLIFGVTFEKWTDGRVQVKAVDALPFWVDMQTSGSTKSYTIVPLDVSVPTWDSYDVITVSETYKSYDRTMSVIGESLNQCRETLGLDAVPVTYAED